MREERKEELVRQFRDFLDRTEEHDPGQPAAAPDLRSFYRELIALKNELKIESRIIKKGLDDFSHLAKELEKEKQTTVDLLRQQDEKVRSRLEKEIFVPLFLDLLELYDRLEAGCDSMERIQPSLWDRLAGGKKYLEAVGTGQKMNLQRLENLMQTYQVTAFSCLGCSFDPARMRAVGMENNPALDDGIVLEELRQGFLWRDKILRFAEVKVNRVPENVRKS